MAFVSHFSNRIESLRDACLQQLAQPLANPLAAEYVLVDNTVMGQWLLLQLAQQQGVAANVRCIQPHELFWLLVRAVVAADIPKQTPLSKQEMLWKLYGFFGDTSLLSQKSMQPVKNYLQGDSEASLKRYQLSATIADLFDQYLIYRPEKMQAWEKGKEIAESEQWQALLWQKLTATMGDAAKKQQHHRAAIEFQLLDVLNKKSSTDIVPSLPMQRLSVFGITSMPPHLQEMLLLLGKHIPVDLFVLNPCQHYWFDVQSAKSMLKNQQKKSLSDGVIGNPLLASQGQQVKDFVGGLYAKLDQYPFEEREYYEAAGKDSLLHCIQQEILDLQYRGEMATLTELPNAANQQCVPIEDLQKKVSSIQIHSCHSPLREVEVLHDQLSALFAQDKTLKPRDVVVMMPQVAPYVPYIDTVFGATKYALPYHISDRTWLEEVPMLHALDFLLSLPENRFPLTDILALLEVPAVQARFAIDRDGYERLKTWLSDAGARWGLDAAHREQCQLPAYSEFSWEFAINRLLAGYGMMQAVSEPVAMADEQLSVMPFDEVEGGSAALLDSFLQCWQQLKKYRTLLAEAATPDVWVEKLHALLDDFFVAQDDDELLALREIRKQIAQLRQANVWCAEIIDLSVVRAVLQPSLQAPSQGKHPWREGVKFCSLMPMRGVPFRVVMMLGMNQNDYPKRHTAASFDVMRKDYRPGDRSRRVDDRWLFLEALLSARDVFHVSYVGRDQRKNEVRQPSVVVSELMDYLRDGYRLDARDDTDGKLLLQCLVQEHPLQPFSREYFFDDKNRKLLSFNKQAFTIASHRENRVESASDDTWLQSKKTKEVVEVSLDSFVKFFTDPERWFFGEKHKKVSLKTYDESVSSDDVMELESGLGTWALKDAFRQMADAISPTGDEEQRKTTVIAAVKSQWQAEGKWPLGATGDHLQQKYLQEMTAHWLDAKHSIIGEPVTHAGQWQCKTSLGDLKINGELPCLGDTLFFHTASKFSEKHQFKLTIQSAFAGVAMKEAVIKSAAFFWDGKNDDNFLIQEKNNEKLMEVLAGLYMQYREGGLPFLSDASLEYQEKHAKKEGVEEWEAIIDNAWDGDGYGSNGAGEDIQKVAYYISKQRLLDPVFKTVAKTIAAARARWKAKEVKS